MASEIIIANNGGRENIKDIGSTFANTSCDNEIALANSLNTDKVACLEQVNGLFKTQDNYGETFYFRGSVNNNWVKFGQTSDNQDIWWRIIRINGDDTVRLIYSGVGGPTTVGDGTQIAADQFNTSGSDNAYVGYMYGDINSDSYAKTHENKYDSKVKKILDSWYQTNLIEETQYIDGATGFCGDRGMPKYSFKANGTYGILGYAKNQTWYAPAERNWGNEPRPTLKCNQENDLYTSKSANRGNRVLQYPIGLITVDEVVYLGGIMYKQNYGYWLCTNKSYWTMSPSDYFPGSSVAFVFPLLEDGQFGTAGYGHVTKPGMGIRPVINLKASVSISGKGLIDNPYTVEV